MSFEPFASIQCTLTDLTGSVIVNERLCNVLIQIVVAKTTLKNSVFDSGTDNISLLWLVNLELGIPRYFVCTVDMLLFKVADIHKTILHKSGNAIFPHNISAAFQHSRVEVVETANSISNCEIINLNIHKIKIISRCM